MATSSVYSSESLSRYAPLFYVFISGIGFSLQNTVVKVLDIQGVDGLFHSILARGVSQTLLCCYFIITSSDRKLGIAPKLFGNDRKVRLVMFIRGVLGFGGVLFPFLTVQRLSIGDGTVLIMLSPFIASILGICLLNEPWRISEILATLIALLGTICVIKPPSIFGDNVANSYDSLGVLYGFGAALCAGSSYIVIRMLGTSVKMPWENICLVQALAQLILTPLFCLALNEDFGMRLTTFQIVLILAGGIIGAIGQAFMTIGMQREKSATASAMRMSDVLFAYVWQVLITSEKISILSIFGATLVVSSMMIVVASKSSNPEIHELSNLQYKERISPVTSDDENSIPSTLEFNATKTSSEKNASRSNAMIIEWKNAIKSKLHSLASRTSTMSLPSYYTYSKLSQFESGTEESLEIE